MREVKMVTGEEQWSWLCEEDTRPTTSHRSWASLPLFTRYGPPDDPSFRKIFPSMSTAQNWCWWRRRETVQTCCELQRGSGFWTTSCHRYWLVVRENVAAIECGVCRSVAMQAGWRCLEKVRASSTFTSPTSLLGRAPPS